MNSVVLMGRLTRDPELKHTASGKEYTRFRIAVDRNYHRETTDFFTVKAWGIKAVFICKYFRKGQKIAVKGEIHTNNWTMQDGTKRTDYEIATDDAFFCEPMNPQEEEECHGVTTEIIEQDDDFPF